MFETFDPVSGKHRPGGPNNLGFALAPHSTILFMMDFAGESMGRKLFLDQIFPGDQSFIISCITPFFLIKDCRFKIT